ncbi:right-handed parallel beta-helix repeat-containing protein [Glaesserella sp.]|uniref:right-handed parallel beta-helix repeat-containing protein n=1 Tax=Glaesserella sp. TaxID=2094731 RepID=UPI0035A0BF9F
MAKYGITVVAANSATNGIATQIGSYKLLKGETETLRIKALKNVNYQLVNAETGEQLEQLNFKRVNGDLHINTKENGSNQPDIIIEDYYRYDSDINGIQANELITTIEPNSGNVITAEKVSVANAAEPAGDGIMGSTLFKILGGIAGLGLVAGAAAGGGSGGGGSSASQPSETSDKAPISHVQEAKSTSTSAISTEHSNNTPNVIDTASANTTSLNASNTLTSENTATTAQTENTLASPLGVSTKITSSNVVKNSINTTSKESIYTLTASKQLQAVTDSTVNDTATNNPTEHILESVDYAKGKLNIYSHSEYGKYIKASDFGTDPTGKTDSLAAIKAAMAKAHELGISVQLSGKLYISDQIVWDNTYSNVKALFGEGNGRVNGTDAPEAGKSVPKTLITFYKEQAWSDISNSNTNTDNVDAYAGILIKGQTNKIVGDLSVQYLHKKETDFYRKYPNSDQDSTYFGKINCILVTDSDQITIQRIEASGANRAGIYFTSSDALKDDPRIPGTANFANLLMSGKITENYQHLPLGENNKVIDSYLHDNRVGGLLFGYQKNFVAEGNLASRNGHEKDGGTGYGIAASAGSYNYGIKYLNNTTDHNYRKGLDIHDGNHIVIEGNTSIGDRLFGIAAYNRHYTMDDVTIKNNTVIQDPTFTLKVDDFGPGNAAKARGDYYSYTAIQLTSNNNSINLNSHKTSSGGKYVINDNVISGLSIINTPYKTATFGIEFRNQEALLDYNVDITNNQIVDSQSASYLIGVFNNTTNTKNVTGLGSGTITIQNNTAELNEVKGGVPIYVQDAAYMTYNATTKRNVIDPTKIMKLRGEVSIEDNIVLVKQASNSDAEALEVYGNAKIYTIRNNTFELEGKINTAVFRISGTGKEKSNLILEDNTVYNKAEKPASVSFLVDRISNVNVDKDQLKTNKYGLSSKIPQAILDAVELRDDTDGVKESAGEIKISEVLGAAAPIGEAIMSFDSISVNSDSFSYPILSTLSTTQIENNAITVF